MKYRFILSSFAFLFLLLFSACQPDDGPVPQKQKTLSNVTYIGEISKADLQARLTPVGLANVVTTGIRAYKFLYNTPMADGSNGKASGLMLMPSTGASNLTLISFQHGTMFNKGEAPSDYNSNGGEAFYIGSAMAAMTKGYMVAMPDYLGYGATANVTHPYIHRKTLASASLDMLRSAREFAKDSNIGLNPEVILAGYSEGGYATVALHKMLDEEVTGEFKVSHSYPGAGPYDIMGTAKTVLQTNKETDPSFVLSYVWVALTYNELYGINAPLNTYFTQENIPAIQAFQAGNMTTAIATINKNPSKVFAPSFINSVVNTVNTPMHNAMQDNNINIWAPSGSVILYHSVDDEWVPVANSQSALAGMKARGAADVTFFPLHGDHGGVGGTQYFTELFTKLQ